VFTLYIFSHIVHLLLTITKGRHYLKPLVITTFMCDKNRPGQILPYIKLRLAVAFASMFIMRYLRVAFPVTGWAYIRLFHSRRLYAPSGSAIDLHSDVSLRSATVLAETEREVVTNRRITLWWIIRVYHTESPPSHFIRRPPP
jgi:hypothetical protein